MAAGLTTMLRILGSKKTLCDGMTRRDLLHIGGLSALGIGPDDALRRQSADADDTRGQSEAETCILLFLFGSPPQHETFDPQPDAPKEVQGELNAIPTSLPGVPLGEGLPRISRIADRLTIVRSMTHPYPVHGVA